MMPLKGIAELEVDIDMWNEFKRFAIRGNVIDLAVGVIIGGAFGKIVSSLVKDVIMPLIGWLLGGINFTGLTYKLGEAKLNYGLFIQSVIDFFIISFSIFLFVKGIQHFKNKETKDNEPIEHKEQLLIEIRDILKEQRSFFRKNETS